MGKHLVFVGGGQAHMTSLENLGYFTSRGHRVTLISASPYHLAKVGVYAVKENPVLFRNLAAALDGGR